MSWKLREHRIIVCFKVDRLVWFIMVYFFCCVCVRVCVYFRKSCNFDSEYVLIFHRKLSHIRTENFY